MYKKILFVICLMATASVTFAKIVGSTKYNGKKYYVDVTVSGASATIWLRTNQDMCTPNDIKVVNLSASNLNFKSAEAKVCRVKRIYDNGKTIAGCLATIASGACAAASVPTGGIAAAFCSATFVYAAQRGFEDCIDGVSNKIADYLGGGPWSSFAVKAGIMKPKWSSVIDTAIDNACNDLK